jgi:hypothetical protein
MIAMLMTDQATIQLLELRMLTDLGNWDPTLKQELVLTV